MSHLDLRVSETNFGKRIAHVQVPAGLRRRRSIKNAVPYDARNCNKPRMILQTLIDPVLAVPRLAGGNVRAFKHDIGIFLCLHVGTSADTSHPASLRDVAIHYWAPAT